MVTAYNAGRGKGGEGMGGKGVERGAGKGGNVQRGGKVFLKSRLRNLDYIWIPRCDFYVVNVHFRNAKSNRDKNQTAYIYPLSFRYRSNLV